MIPTNRAAVLDRGLAELQSFATRKSVRGRFVALYLGLRRMGSQLQPLGSETATAARELEEFLDQLYTKTHRPPPYIVLTAPFGGSTSPTAPYGPRTGEVAPGRTAANTWRNNFGIQKGVGCPADSDLIMKLLEVPSVRLACPHMSEDDEGRPMCGIDGTHYRGEEHSIWLRKIAHEGYQVVPLDKPAVYSDYLRPGGERIPIFPLIAVLYSFAPASAYPVRSSVGIPEFAIDFHFDLDQVRELFDCDPDSQANASVLAVVQDRADELREAPPFVALPSLLAAGPLPIPGPSREINDGVGAELAVAADLARWGWKVLYRGNQRSVGYDLEAQRESQILRVEVKSSIGFTIPELTAAEWDAAQRCGDEYIIAVVDFYGSPSQSIWYVRNPMLTTTPVEISAVTYRLPRAEVEHLKTDAEFL